MASGLGFLVLLFVVFAAGDRLVWLSKPVNDVDFVSTLSKSQDVRGAYGNFVLLVSKESKETENVVFEAYDNGRFSYFVAEIAALDHFVPTGPFKFKQYQHARVQDKLVFQIEKEGEDIFVSKIPSYVEIVKVPESAIYGPIVASEYNLPASPNDAISNLISLVNSADLKAFVTYLTGEASTIITRQAQSTGAVAAQTYLQQQFSQFGFTVGTQAFRNGYSSNVVATLRGVVNPTKLVLVTAHYDSRGPQLSSTTERAPGANDNGSGTGSLLQIAKLIFQNKLSFGYTVVLIAFSGEEQGLYGSAYAAEQYRNQGADIVAVLNGDMLAYRAPAEVPQLAFTSRSSTTSLSNALTNITRTYVSKLTVGTTTACCTDHSSFYNQGFPATSFYERNGNIVDPEYHKSGDLVNRPGYDIDGQYPLIVQAIFAGLLTLANLQS